MCVYQIKGRRHETLLLGEKRRERMTEEIINPNRQKKYKMKTNYIKKNQRNRRLKKGKNLAAQPWLNTTNQIQLKADTCRF